MIKFSKKFIEKKQRYREDTGYIDPHTLPINDEGYRCCRYCSGSIKPPKRTFCSAKCVHEYRLRSNGTYLRQQVYLRDHGICALCKLDTKKLAVQLTMLSIDDPRRDLLFRQHNIHKTRKIKLRRNGGGLWDADHIICVKDGGGQCGLENIRTLCIKCHKSRTADSASKNNKPLPKIKLQLKNKSDQNLSKITIQSENKSNPNRPKVKLQLKNKLNIDPPKIKLQLKINRT